MSFGTVDPFKTKKALREAVAQRGAENVRVEDTSMFDNKGVVSIASLVGTSADIVGPDVYNNRAWYASVRRNVRGEIVIV